MCWLYKNAPFPSFQLNADTTTLLAIDCGADSLVPEWDQALAAASGGAPVAVGPCFANIMADTQLVGTAVHDSMALQNEAECVVACAHMLEDCTNISWGVLHSSPAAILTHQCWLNRVIPSRHIVFSCCVADHAECTLMHLSLFATCRLR